MKIKHIAITLVSLALLFSCKTVQMSHGVIESKTTHIHSEMGGWEIFEVSSRGQGHRSMKDNAKMNLNELIRYGYRGQSTYPLLTTPKALRMYEQSINTCLPVLKANSTSQPQRSGRSDCLKTKQNKLLFY